MNARAPSARGKRITPGGAPGGPFAAPRGGIRDGEVHVWRGVLGAAPPDPVTPDEAARAHAMGSARRRREFLACRGALRRVLAALLGTEPLAVPIVEGPHGKPALGPAPDRAPAPGREPGAEPGSGPSPGPGSGPSREPDTGAGANPASTPGPLGFNLSHSGERFLIAAARGCEPGVDVERIRPRADLERLARRFFSPAERRALAAAVDPALAFHRLWARKEAVIKADGRGVSIGLARFDVSADEPPALLGARWAGAAADEAARWSLFSLDVGAGYAAALAVRRCEVALVIHDLPPVSSL